MLERNEDGCAAMNLAAKYGTQEVAMEIVTAGGDKSSEFVMIRDAGKLQEYLQMKDDMAETALDKTADPDVENLLRGETGMKI